MSKDYLMGCGSEQWKEGKAYEVTFIVTEDCNLRCSYCYEVHKNNKKRMTFETAKKSVDYILDNEELYDAPAVIWDFIGGEPLLEIELIDKISDYIKIQSYRKKHKWLNDYRFNIGTNGTLYNQPLVSKYIRKNKDKLSISMTIDGTERKHDLHRVYEDGRGSYNDVFKNIPKWLSDMPDSTTKVTFGSEDLIYLKESIIHLWKLGLKDVPANVVYEDVWKDGDDKIFEKQLISLADYVIDNKLWNNVNCTLFDENLGGPITDFNLKSNFCGTGRMLAIDANGDFYPCLRFSDFSLNDKCGRPIGNINEGIILDKVRPFLTLSTENISKKECIKCEVASGCAWCQGSNYDCANNSSIYNRATYICEMHKARIRGNNYYWDRLKREHNVRRKTEPTFKKNMYFILSDDSVEHCSYTSKSNSKNIMSEELLKKALNYCEKNFFKPIVLNSKTQENIIDLDSFSVLSRIEIRDLKIKPIYKNTNEIVCLNIEDIDEYTGESNCILNIYAFQINQIYSSIEKLLEKSKRINLVFKCNINEIDLKLYESELFKIKDLLIKFYEKKQYKEVNVITDRIFLNAMDNCECGENNYAIAPNGRIYICPAFYFNNPEDFIGNIDDGITEDKLFNCDMEHSPICLGCDAYQCNRCVYHNINCTREYNIPGHKQCEKSHIERNTSMILQKLIKDYKLPIDLEEDIKPLDYSDPIELIIAELDVNPYASIK
ncbi:radical SAM peptide maturase, CXXX-repeat target family [Clostridioides difficile]